MNPPAPPENITLTVFVSSPNEFEKEKKTRSLAREVIQAMSGMIVEGKTVTFIPMLWEDHLPATAGIPAQMAVDYFMGRADEMDIYIGMFWTTLGSPVIIQERRHPSGTLYEFECAYKSFRQTASPSLLLYRCNERAHAKSTSKGLASVRRFFKSLHGEYPQFHAFPRGFVGNDEFADMLREDLERTASDVIKRRSNEVNATDPTSAVTKKKSSDEDEAIQTLIKRMEIFLANDEDLFAELADNDKLSERERAFKISYRALADPHHPEEAVSNKLLPLPGESLLSLYDQRGHQMVFVGEKGAGKTFSLLQLIQELLYRVQNEGRGPVPVHFNLSSWHATHEEDVTDLTSVWTHLRIGDKHKPGHPLSSGENLDRWLEEQLLRHYSIKAEIAQTLLAMGRLIICLDGLDELSFGNAYGDEKNEAASCALRNACVRAINGTLENRAAQMILCCRDQTFEELTCKPKLGSPLQAQPLPENEVQRHLRVWPRLDGLRQAMNKSPQLREKARLPLFLGMMKTAYQDMAASQILINLNHGDAEWQKHLLDHYVQQLMEMVPPKSATKKKGLIPACLGWMASQQDNDFLLDDMQPHLLRVDDFFESMRWYDSYRKRSVNVLAVSLTIIETLPLGPSLAIEWASKGLWVAIACCLGMWAASAAVLLPLYWIAFSSDNWRRFGLCFGVAWGFDLCVYQRLSTPAAVNGIGGSWADGLHIISIGMPCAIVFFMLYGMQFYGRLDEYKKTHSKRQGIEWYEIQPIEPRNWRWFNSESGSPWQGGAWIGVSVGLLITAALWLCLDMTRGIGAGLVITVMLTLVSGLSGTGLVRASIKPNQAIARSLHNAWFMSATLIATSVLCLGCTYGLTLKENNLVQAFVNACLGLIMAFTFYLFGGIPVIRQFCLGQILHEQGRLPAWKCWPPWKWKSTPPWQATVQFLDELVLYKLLRRSAGGYVFRHDTLREYYRALSKKT